MKRGLITLFTLLSLASAFLLDVAKQRRRVEETPILDQPSRWGNRTSINTT